MHSKTNGCFPTLPLLKIWDETQIDWEAVCVEMDVEMKKWTNVKETTRHIVVKDVHFASVDTVLLVNVRTYSVQQHNIYVNTESNFHPLVLILLFRMEKFVYQVVETEEWRYGMSWKLALMMRVTMSPPLQTPNQSKSGMMLMLAGSGTWLQII